MVEDGFFGVGENRAAEAHLPHVPYCGCDFGGCFAGAELLVERPLQDGVEEGVAVDVEQEAPVGLAECGEDGECWVEEEGFGGYRVDAY